MDSRTDMNARIARIVRTYQDGLLRLAYAYVRNAHDAEDIAQEVFLAFFRAAPVFDSAEHEKAYLLRVTINRCKNHLKSGWARSRRPLEDARGVAGEQPPSVLGAVLSLDEKYRAPIHLHYYEGYSIAEIAQILGLSKRTVDFHIDNAREKLGAATRVEAAIKAATGRLIEP